ncbi:MAG: hypothetical protein JJP05_09015 [cyanobacterium endosymbiont of Rhopalodia gibba]|jgi:hypothetical protein
MELQNNTQSILNYTARLLTRTKQEKTIRVTKRFKVIGGRFGVILPSPLMRAF